MVRTISLNDGKKIPALGWGNGTGGIQKSGHKATDLGATALRAGILHIDTAQGYGTETETGLAIQKGEFKRDDVWVTTKNVKTTPEDIRKSIQESLDKIGFIPDLFLIHTPFVPAKGKIIEFWQVLEGLVEDGTLKRCSLGVSNFRPQDLEEVFSICRIKPVVNQLEYHPYVLAHLDPVVAIHEKYGMKIQSYGPLTPILRHKSGGPLKPILTRIAQTLSSESGKPVDEAAVLLLWTIGKGAVAVTTSGNPDNIKKMAATEQLRDLTKAEIDEIDQAGRKVHFRGYPEHMSEDFPAPDLPADL